MEFARTSAAKQCLTWRMPLRFDEELRRECGGPGLNAEVVLIDCSTLHRCCRHSHLYHRTLLPFRSRPHPSILWAKWIEGARLNTQDIVSDIAPKWSKRCGEEAGIDPGSCSETEKADDANKRDLPSRPVRDIRWGWHWWYLVLQE